VQRDAQIEFLLSDTGPGIRPDQLPHVFERFWQVDSDTRRGLGLGLYICEQLVGAHGGHIWVESEVGKGATFHFTLPLT
jgi:signal transduction histidine kinase